MMLQGTMIVNNGKVFNLDDNNLKKEFLGLNKKGSSNPDGGVMPKRSKSNYTVFQGTQKIEDNSDFDSIHKMLMSDKDK